MFMDSVLHLVDLISSGASTLELASAADSVVQAWPLDDQEEFDTGMAFVFAACMSNTDFIALAALGELLRRVQPDNLVKVLEKLKEAAAAAIEELEGSDV